MLLSTRSARSLSDCSTAACCGWSSALFDKAADEIEDLAFVRAFVVAPQPLKRFRVESHALAEPLQPCVLSALFDELARFVREIRRKAGLR